MRLDGVNLGTVVPGTGIQLSGPKITESNAIALDAATAQATLDTTASVGYRDVTVTTSGGSFTRSSGFRVNVPGQVPMITDVSPAIVTPGTTTPMVVTGSNFDGGAVLVTGPGATVTNVVVDPGGTRITFDLTLAADAPAETRGVIVVTANGTARCNVATAAPEPPFEAAKLVKTGALFTVTSSAFRLPVRILAGRPVRARLQTAAISTPTASSSSDATVAISRCSVTRTAATSACARSRRRTWSPLDRPHVRR
jgi:hypothetical protein